MQAIPFLEKAIYIRVFFGDYSLTSTRLALTMQPTIENQSQQGRDPVLNKVSGGAPKVQARYWQVRMKLSGKKDPVATISGKFPEG
jgi:hypothetical protein